MMYGAGVLVTVAAAMSVCQGENILAIFPSQSRSHIISFTALTTELARRGHSVTVISTYPQKERIVNYTDIAVPYLFDDVEKNLDIVDVANKSYLWFMAQYVLHTKRMCDHFLQDPGVIKLLISGDEHFDLVIIEIFMSECLFGFAHKFNAPVIAVFSQAAPHYLTDLVGSPSPYAYVPETFVPYGDHMTFKERLINAVLAFTIKLGRQYLVIPYHNMFMKRHFNHLRNLPYLGDLMQKNISMLFLNNDVSCSIVRPYLPNVIEVGGMHIQEPKRLPKDIQEFLDGSKDGAIYVSFGTNLKTYHMDASLKLRLMDAFSVLRQRVLMKWDDDVPRLLANVKVGTWLPQSDILAHPNVKVFITHGGALSIQEAAYRGVPVIGIPVYSDQGQNVNNAQRLGFGITLDVNNISIQSLQWAVTTIINQSSYIESANRVSGIFRDQLTSPLERAVFWSEYVLRHKGAPHLQSAARDLTWYQYFLLDGVALFLFLSLPPAYVVTRVLLALYRTPNVREAVTAWIQDVRLWFQRRAKPEGLRRTLSVAEVMFMERNRAKKKEASQSPKKQV